MSLRDAAVARRYFGLLALAAALALGAPSTAPGCDICAVYTATEMQDTRTGLRLGIAQQYTHFHTLQHDGDEIPNPNNERLNSSITQLVFGYQVHPRARLQMNVPIIAREFRRMTETGVQKGDESGFGDLSITASVLPWSYVSEHSVIRFTLMGGLKFPTGSSDRLEEELPNDPLDDLNGQVFAAAEKGGGAHDEALSGVHGHDLALGTGSFDPVLGGQVLVTWDRFYCSGGVQYLIRTRGDFDYRYANELIADLSPGAFLLMDHEFTLGLGASLRTETKGKDDVDGDTLDDTGITALYAGPGLQFTWATSLSAELVGDLPAIMNNTALQIVPDFRIRGGLVWRF